MKHSKSSLFLMEMIIAILFFSLASTVCIQLFSKSHLLSQQTVNQNHAMLQAQNLAEMFLAADGNVAQMKILYPNDISDTAENTFVIWFDENWKECDAGHLYYVASLTAQPEEKGLLAADIRIYRASLEGSVYGSHDNPLYSLNIVHHVPERRGSYE